MANSSAGKRMEASKEPLKRMKVLMFNEATS
jgi:hypothetical protein